MDTILATQVIKVLPILTKQSSSLLVTQEQCEAVSELLPGCHTDWLPSLMALLGFDDPILMIKEVMKYQNSSVPTCLKELTFAHWIAHSDDSTYGVSFNEEIMNDFYEMDTFDILKETDLENLYAADMCIMCGAKTVDDVLRMIDEYSA